VTRLIDDVQSKLESLKRLDHLSKLLQGEKLPINDECDFAIGIGDPASHCAVGGLEVSRLSLLNMPCGKRFLDAPSKSTECQIGTRRIELPEEESLPLFAFFCRLHTKPKAGVEVRDHKVPGLTGAVGKRLSNRKVLVGIVTFARFVGKSPTAVGRNHVSHFLKANFTSTVLPNERLLAFHGAKPAVVSRRAVAPVGCSRFGVNA